MKIILILLSVCVITACSDKTQYSSDRYLGQEYWKNQALADILPYWTKYAVDSVHGSFFCSLDGNWKPEGDIKFPSMIARHLFSYSAAYLISGEDEYIKRANEIKNYLITHSWDNKHGGWFDALTATGEPLHAGKSTFVQVYVNTGLAMYYFVTRDSAVFEYINNSNSLLEENAWDQEFGGYFDALEQDWTLKTDIKTISSQLAPVSGYLLYLYMATHDKKYLEQAERICDTMLGKMRDPRSGWLLESFDRKLNYVPGKQDNSEINIGHNIELAWSLLRLHLLNNRIDYLDAGKQLADSVHHYGFNEKTGVWYATIGKNTPDQHSTFAYWWIQAYGNMFDLCLQKIDPNPKNLENFKKGSAFWDQYFLDKAKGDTHLSVLETGEPQDVRKANQFKASYHSVEHCMLNYFYLAGWVNPRPFSLYFKLTSSAEGDKLYPMPIEKLSARVREATLNGKSLEISSRDLPYVTVPAIENGTLVIKID